jgi:hypothetical protein
VPLAFINSDEGACVLSGQNQRGPTVRDHLLDVRGNFLDAIRARMKKYVTLWPRDSAQPGEVRLAILPEGRNVRTDSCHVLLGRKGEVRGVLLET